MIIVLGDDCMASSVRGATQIELVIGAAIIGLFVWFAYSIGWIPSPIGFTDVWIAHGSMGDGLASVWYIFLWGVGFTLASFILTGMYKKSRTVTPGEVAIEGLGVSLFAGVVEELAYRWFMLFGGMFILNVLNFLTFGLIKWLNVELFIPLTNWLTFGILSPQLTDNSWLFGAAIVFANSSFRDAHEHKGFITYVNAWILGIVFFYVMFNYGLLTAIVAHVLYDLCIYATLAVCVSLQPKRTHRSIYFS
jgi:hypothetical protein